MLLRQRKDIRGEEVIRGEEASECGIDQDFREKEVWWWNKWWGKSYLSTNENESTRVMAKLRIVKVGEVFRHWRVTARLDSIHRQVKKATQVEHKVKLTRLENELREAVLRTNPAEVARIARLIGGKGRGAKKRMLGRLQIDEPSRDDWVR